MSTPDWLADRIRAYYAEVTERNYLLHWSPRGLALHLGIDRPGTRTIEEAQENGNREVAERGGIGAGTRVLDAGCGVGGTALWLARERGARVVGLTLSPRQAELARAFALERGVADRVEIEAADFTTAPLPADFEVVFNLESLCHVLDVRSWLSRARGLLVDGGRYVCIDFFRGEGGDREALGAMCDGWVLPALRSIEEVAADLVGAGFAEVEAQDRTADALVPAGSLRVTGLLGLLLLQDGARRGLPGAPLRRGNALGAVGAAEGLRTGSVRYGILRGVARRGP